jgi:hypothetical protein
LFRDSGGSLKLISDALCDAIIDAAPAVLSQNDRGGGRVLRLSDANLTILPAAETRADPWNWERPSL